jgi:hypothetical protein
MTRSAQVKLALTVAGLAVWAVGAKTDNGTIRWVGIAFIAFAFLLRFFRRAENSSPGE